MLFRVSTDIRLSLKLTTDNSKNPNSFKSQDIINTAGPLDVKAKVVLLHSC